MNEYCCYLDITADLKAKWALFTKIRLHVIINSLTFLQKAICIGSVGNYRNKIIWIVYSNNQKIILLSILGKKLLNGGFRDDQKC